MSAPDRPDYRVLLEHAYLSLEEMQAKLEASERARHEPIAIIGMGCRFPGGANDPEAFWRLIEQGVDAITEVPADRWEASAFYDPAPGTPGKMRTRWGGFLADVDRFDAGFFGIAPREAARMDPQQRLWLEVAWEALEAAGQPAARLSRSRTGVFVGICSSDYGRLEMADLAAVDAYDAAGGAYSIVANRLSYLLDLQGPSVAVDTACSSSLVAVHLACQSLRNQECEMAVAGGVNLILSPENTISLSSAGMLAPDGRSKTFDASADGTVRGEGCGAVILKRLSDALVAGDPIQAVIRGSAVNQDGRSNGLTAPNLLAQQAVLREALANAGVLQEEVTYIEAHGTGTALGDPIEVEALASVYGEPRAEGQWCALGAVKTNIGHLEAAAGVAALIKTVLALRHQTIPRHLHFRALNPHISLENTPFVIPTAPLCWPAGARRRYAGVSSFGFGGTNAHLVLEEFSDATPKRSQEKGTHLLPLSAGSAEALRTLAEGFREMLRDADAPSLSDICYTASVRRSEHAHRLAVVGGTHGEMAESLADFAPTGGGERQKLAFVFSGQGAQWAGMGRDLLKQEPIFRAVIEECDVCCCRLAGWSLLDELRAEPEHLQLKRTDIAHPVLFAIQAATAALWRSWGVEAEAVVGHSSGEIAAAYHAGILSLADAMHLVCQRARLMQRTDGEGAMAALEQRGVQARRMAMPDGLHSPQMAAQQSDLMRALEGLKPQPGRLPMVSTLTGQTLEGRRYDATYWSEQVQSPVQFRAAIETLVQQDYGMFVEIGPHAALSSSIQNCLRTLKREGVALPSFRRGRDGRPVMLRTLGELYVRGVKVAWDRLYPEGGRCVPLPAYPWQRQRYWFKEGLPRSRPAASAAAHPLLGRRLRSALPEAQFESEIRITTPAFLADHVIAGEIMFPLAGYLEMMLAAGNEPGVLENIAIERPLILEKGRPRALQLVRAPEIGGSAATQIFSAIADTDAQEPAWVRHVTGHMRPAGGGQPKHVSLEGLRRRCAEELSVDAHYSRLRAHGLEYGASFQGIAQLWRGDGEALGRVRLPSELADTAKYRLHPVMLDACFQVLAAVLPISGNDIYLPISVERLQFHRRIENEVWCHASLRNDRGNFYLIDAEGVAVADIEGLLLKKTSPTTPRRDLEEVSPDWLYELAWRPQPAEAANPVSGQWLIYADRGGIGEALAVLLKQRGASCMLTRSYPDSIGWKTSYRGVVHLWNVDADPQAPWEPVQQRGCGSVVELVKSLATERLWLVTRGGQAVGSATVSPEQAPVWGLAAALRHEQPELRCVSIDLDPRAEAEAAAANLVTEVCASGNEDQVAWRDGQRYAARLVRRKAAPATDHQPVVLEIEQKGVLENLRLRPVARRAPAAGEIEIRVLATGLNFRDVLSALDLYPGGPVPLGGECAGKVVAVGEGVEDLKVGDAVVALAPRSFGNYVTADGTFVLRKPEGLSFAQAAGLPIAYLTAHYALEHVAGLRAGERVLIHAAAGGVGLAAVHLARRIGAEIYATAGSPAKRAYLEKLGVTHVFDSRSLAFPGEIRSRTSGEGVDVVLNSLTGDFLTQSLALVRSGGHFVELGKREGGERSFDLGEVCAAQPELIRKMLRELLDDISAGVLDPLPCRTFPLEAAADAFRYMAQARHTGKIVVTQPDGARGVSAEGAYLITGGLGGLGLAVAEWLVSQGARRLVLTGRSSRIPEAPQAIARMERAGCHVLVKQADVADAAQVAGLLQEISQLRGIIHAAGVLDDGVVAQQDWDRFARVLAPKLAGTWHLHRLTQNLPLDFFVMFSSAAALLGPAGQGSYAAANAFLDALAHYRRAQGLPATSINWGPWADVGMAANHRWTDRGLESLKPQQALGVLGAALREDFRQVAVLPVNWRAWSPQGSPLLAELTSDHASPPCVQPELRDRLEEAPAERRRAVLEEHLCREAIQVLGLGKSYPLDPRQPLQELGLDSLMAVELRNSISLSLGRSISATLLFDYPTIEGLAAHLAGDSEAKPAPREPQGLAQAAAAVEQLSEYEAERLLQQRLEKL